MLGQIGTGADEGGDLGLLFDRQAWRRPRCLAVRQPGHALVVVAMHPVAQGLAIHAAGFRRFGPGAAIEDQGERPHAPGRGGILGPRRCVPQTLRVELRPSD